MIERHAVSVMDILPELSPTRYDGFRFGVKVLAIFLDGGHNKSPHTAMEDIVNMTRDDALALVKAHDPDAHLVEHGEQTAAVMEALAARFAPGQEELWALTGLLHDVDFPMTKDDPARHGVAAAEIIGDALPPEALHAIAAHNAEHTGAAPAATLDWALRCAESVTGLIKAAALVRPDGYQGMKAKSLKKKMKDKSFAANVDRDRIRECDTLGLELGEFFDLAVAAMAAHEQQGNH
jgi:predicted hydrolase (HD superfamily)